MSAASGDAVDAPEGWFDPERFEAARRVRGITLGHPVVALASASSTNDLALEAERNGAPSGATFLAWRQTAGRGRRGNAWWAPAGDNLTCSVLLRPELEAGHMNSLPLIVGLAVRELVADRLASVFPQPAILVKWPNDVWVGTRKIAGILVESRLRGAVVSAAVLGIGLNVRTLDFPEELMAQATSLARELRPRRRRYSPQEPIEPSAPPIAFEDLLLDLLARFEPRYRRFVTSGLESFLPELEACDALRGLPIRVEDLVGTAAGITKTGALRLIDEQGVERLAYSGHVELL